MIFKKDPEFSLSLDSLQTMQQGVALSCPLSLSTCTHLLGSLALPMLEVLLASSSPTGASREDFSRFSLEAWVGTGVLLCQAKRPSPRATS